MTADRLTLPTFLVIGEQKCGTGWIRDRLMEHPEVFMAPREINFFNRRVSVEQGIEAYARAFARAVEPIVGEKSPEYFWEQSGLAEYNQDFFRLIDKALPNVRIILVLRSPVERAMSALLHHTLHRGRRIHPRIVREHLVSDILLSSEFDLSHLGIVERGFYAQRLMRAQEIFGERLCTLIFEHDIVKHPEQGLDRICDHIGASKFKRFRYRENQKSNKPSYAAALWSHNLEMARPLIRFLDHGEPFRPNIGPECRHRLWEVYKTDVASVEQHLETSLQVWRPK